MKTLLTISFGVVQRTEKKRTKKKLDEHAELFCQSFLDFLVAVAVGESQSCFAKAFLTFSLLYIGNPKLSRYLYF